MLSSPWWKSQWGALPAPRAGMREAATQSMQGHWRGTATKQAGPRRRNPKGSWGLRKPAASLLVADIPASPPRRSLPLPRKPHERTPFRLPPRTVRLPKALGRLLRQRAYPWRVALTLAGPGRGGRHPDRLRRTVDRYRPGQHVSFTRQVTIMRLAHILLAASALRGGDPEWARQP